MTLDTTEQTTWNLITEKDKLLMQKIKLIFDAVLYYIQHKRSEKTLKPDNFSFQKAAEFSLLYTKTFPIIRLIFIIIISHYSGKFSALF